MIRRHRNKIRDSDGEGMAHMDFFSPVVQSGPLHEKQNIDSNEARRSADSQLMYEGPPPPSAIRIKRKPLGNVMNNDNCTSESDSPNRSSKADKWAKVINEAYDKNGLDSPLRSSSKSTRSIKSGDLLGHQVVDSFEIHAIERKSFGGTKNAVDSFNLYPVEGVEGNDWQRSQDGLNQSSCATPNARSEPVTPKESQTPAYLEFDPDVSQHIRKTKLSRAAQAGLFSVVKKDMGANHSQSDDHFSSTSSDNTSDSSDGINNMKVKSRVDASSSLVNEAINDGEGSTFDPWEKARVDSDQCSEQGVNEMDTISHRISPQLNFGKPPRLPRSGSTIGSASVSTNSTSTSAWVRRLPPHTPSPSSFRPAQLDAIKSMDSSSTDCTNTTDEVEECIADVLQQVMASDDVMKSTNKRNKLPPSYNDESNVSKSPYRLQHRSSKYEPNRARKRANSFVDNSGETSNFTNTNSTQEIEECVADVLEQSAANDSTMMRNNKWSTYQLALRSCEHDNTSEEIEECVADVIEQSPHHRESSTGANIISKSTPHPMTAVKNNSRSSRFSCESLSAPAKSINSKQSPIFSTQIRQEQQERINRMVQTMALSPPPPPPITKFQGPVTDSFQKNSNSAPKAEFTKCSSASDPFSTLDSADSSFEESLEEMLADFDRILDDDSSNSNPCISYSDDSGKRDHSYPTDIVQSSMALSGKDRIDFLTAKASDLVSVDEFEEALIILWGVLKIQQSTYGDDHSEVASAHHNLGIVHAKCAQNATSVLEAKNSNTFAMKEFRIAAHVARQTKGELHPNVAVSLARIGLIQIQVGMYTDAVVTFQECLRIRQIAFGKRHSLVGKIHNNLGVAYLSLGSFGKGLEAFESACLNQRRTIRKIVEGDTDKMCVMKLELADTLCNIGSVCLDWAERKGLSGEKKSKLTKNAIVAFDEVIEIRCKALGDSDGLVEEARQLKKEAERQMEKSYNRPVSPDISILQPIIPISGKSEHETSCQRNGKEAFEHQSVGGDEESCLISQGKNGGCIASPWDEYSIPFDESSGCHSIQAKDSVQMQRVEPSAWGDPISYNDSRSKKISSTTVDCASSREANSDWVSFECLDGSYETTREEGFNVSVAQYRSDSKTGKAQCGNCDVSRGRELELSIDESILQSSSASTFVASRTSTQSRSQDKSLREMYLSISKPPSVDERRCDKESPFSPFGAPSFPASKFNMDSGKNNTDENVDNSIKMRGKHDKDQLHSLRGILRSGRSYQNQLKRSQLNVKGEDSLYDTTTSDISMGIERDLSKIEKSKDSLNMSGDGLVMPAGLKDEIRRNSKVDKDIMLENPGKYNLEIHELAAQSLKVSFRFESACKSCVCFYL